jgi:hypothetical protein
MAATSGASEYSIDRKLSALVEQARPSAAAMRAAAEAVDAVAELVKRVPQQQATPEAARGFVRDLGLEGEKLSFTFRPPEVVRLAGSHAAGAVARPDVAADLLVRLPKVCRVLRIQLFDSLQELVLYYRQQRSCLFSWDSLAWFCLWQLGDAHFTFKISSVMFVPCSGCQLITMYACLVKMVQLLFNAQLVH